MVTFSINFLFIPMALLPFPPRTHLTTAPATTYLPTYPTTPCPTPPTYTCTHRTTAYLLPPSPHTLPLPRSYTCSTTITPTPCGSTVGWTAHRLPWDGRYAYSGFLPVDVLRHSPTLPARRITFIVRKLATRIPHRRPTLPTLYRPACPHCCLPCLPHTRTPPYLDNISLNVGGIL